MRDVLNWTVIVICLVILIYMMVVNGLLGTLLPIYSTEIIGLSLAQYALLVSAGTVGNISGNLAGEILGDKLGRKKALFTASVVGIAAIFGLTIFRSFIPLLFTMYFMGISWGTIFSVAPA